MASAIRTFVLSAWYGALATRDAAVTINAAAEASSLLQRHARRERMESAMLDSDLQKEADAEFDRASDEFSAPGAPWTEEEALAVYAKIVAFLDRQSYKRDNMDKKLECYADGPDANMTDATLVPCSHYKNGWHHRGVTPSFPMMLRFGFHQCFKHKHGGGGGCDGRMQVAGAFKRFIDGRPRFSCTGGSRRRRGVAPKCYGHEGSNENAPGHNANLILLADMLERVYTEPAYPHQTPVVGKSVEFPSGRSLKDSGKSRADLWAFAALVGAHRGLVQANDACNDNTSLYAVWPVVPCKMTLPPIRFYTGRRDWLGEVPQPACESTCLEPVDEVETYTPDPGCKKGWLSCEYDKRCQRPECKDCDMCLPNPEGKHKPRPYETTRSEAFPGTTFVGQTLTNYFKDNFNFTKREAIAIMGAHSFGDFHGEVSGGFRYGWTHQQTEQLNNVYYRIIALENMPFYERTGRWGYDMPPTAVMAPGGKVPRTFLFLHEDGKDVGGGHFQYFHSHERCPFCTDDGVMIDRHLISWGDQRLNRTLVRQPDGRRLEVRNTPRPDKCCKLCKKATNAVSLGRDPANRHALLYNLEGLTEAEEKEFYDGKCFQNSSVHETLFVADLALHRNVQTDSGGKPLNCRTGGGDCPLNELQDDGDMKMHEIVEQYAADQNTWAIDFMKAMRKMLSNGVQGDELTESFDLTGVECEKKYQDRIFGRWCSKR
eukprot:TRINITY_DN113289_c0_g1_i1.p1 TRINITY_DN113289_c0_g1~~TRINITY_DN113289_c0_g1_i1.p1  ORF type:complete len:713 (+),score=117.09 TRINITY_DN113289_c0_g1_i1:110-2248(+)